MRWISTPESVERNEPTALAIFETVLAVAAYWGIAVWFDTHIHLLVSICVAPLLLLRSKESTEKGVRWFAAYWNRENLICLQSRAGNKQYEPLSVLPGLSNNQIDCGSFLVQSILTRYSNNAVVRRGIA
uniref:Uncharacterized protein n=1 Tax=Candidatus Kentrum sp. FW TaxID=2126338 RepID=A0A450SFP1_9GAMM|nr:MAG: hypothetical protein BECKFW1821A_GA0114235_10188 [Candidatus Kentron sp. FW]VFJ51698.1 MAG: hypothetical protein BECKFW1821B_GA0114236_10106 [Candidatus Kentron sp. FW]